MKLTGTLSYITHEGYYIYVKESDDYFLLNFVNESHAEMVPLGVELIILVDPTDDGNVFNVTETEDFFVVLSDKMELESGKPSKHIGVYRTIITGTDEPVEEPSEENKKTLRSSANLIGKEVKQFYRQLFRHIWDVDITPYVLWGDEDRVYPPSFSRLTRRARNAEGHLPGYDDIDYHAIWGGYIKGICGQGGVPGGACVTYRQSSCGAKTMCHELGHNFGLMHANAILEEGGQPQEYADRSSIMGSVTSLVGFNSPQRVFFGADPEETIVRVKETGQYLLCPIELETHSMHQNEVKHIIFEGTDAVSGGRGEPVIPATNAFHISLRKSGQGHHYGANGTMLFVHEFTNRKATVLHSYLNTKPGDTFTLPNGAVIEYLELKDETARINVLLNPDDPKPTDIPMPQGFPQHMPSVELSEKHSGSWYDPEMNGQGFDIQVKDGRLAFYWYTFNKGSDSRRFYYGTCLLKDGLEQFDIFTNKRGTFDNPEYSYPVKMGTGQIIMYDDTTGVFNYNFNEQLAEYAKFGRGSIEIQPVALSEDNTYNGIYYNSNRDGEGFTVQYFHDMETCVAYWYTYGPKPTGGGGVDIHTQRWYTCVGNKSEDGTYDLTIHEVIGGKWKWLADADEVNLVEVGKATLGIVDDNNITFEFDIDAEHYVKGTGKYELTRLF